MSRVSVKLRRKSRYKDVTDQYISQSKTAVFLGCQEIRTIAVTGIKDGIKTGKNILEVAKHTQHQPQESILLQITETLLAISM